MDLNIGSITIDPPVVLAPMAGITNAAFRKLCREHGAGLYVSEMISARALVEDNSNTTHMLIFGEDETIRSVQLYGVDPPVMYEAARRLVDEWGVHHIDLNFGCPVAKVTRKGGGAALPLHTGLFAAIVRETVRAAGAVPVTVKMRIGVDASTPTALRAGVAAAEEGAAAVALHARTAEQLYSGSADWRAIAELKATVHGVPVLGNGDIWHATDALRMVAATGCDGVVIGRGCLGRPWMFRDLVDAFHGRPVQAPPSTAVVVATMRRHVELLCELHGEDSGVRDFRKHVGWYLTGYPVGPARRRRLTAAESLAELHAGLDDIDPTLTLPPDLAALPRGRMQGPRRVQLPDGWLEQADDLTPPDGADLVVSGG
jgi:nifR3 family TIM-barrel protein